MQSNQSCDRCQNNPNKEVRIKIFANGQPQYCQQCKDCGARVSTWLGKNHPDVLRMAERVYFDEIAEAGYHDARQRQWREQLELRKQVIMVDRSIAPRGVDYHQYLTTKEWWARRELVMKRAGGMCEGCGTARAVNVHHMTYQHLGAEFLWELRAVCRACHERFHDINEQQSGSGS